MNTPMRTFLAILLLAGAPFWEVKPPGQWSPDEIRAVLTVSPWVTNASLSGAAVNVPGVRVYLASAKPIQEAEEEVRRRHLDRRASLQDEALAWLQEYIRINTVAPVQKRF